MTEHAKAVAARLQKDIDLLVDALNSLQGGIERLRERFPEDRLQIQVSESLALWAHYRFDGDWSAFVEFGAEALQNWSREKSQLWVVRGPEWENPEPEADRHLHRVYMGLEFISKELNSPVPYHPESHWYPRENAARLQAYVRAANDVLNPENA